LPSRRTPPIFPFRIRLRNLWDGGAVRVPMTVSAVSEKPGPAERRAGPTGLARVAPWPANTVTTETAATAAEPANALIIANRVALLCGRDCPGAAPD
jgi:hypothetical protein